LYIEKINMDLMLFYAGGRTGGTRMGSAGRQQSSGSDNSAVARNRRARKAPAGEGNTV